MSLFGAIVDYYDDSTDEDVVALRTALGVNHLWTGRPPSETALPYVSVTNISVVPQSQSKSNSSRVDEWTVQFSCFDDSLADVENILDLLETAYLRSELTVAGKSNLIHYPMLSSRGTMLDEEIKGLWHGFVQIRWLVKSTI